MPYLSHLVCKYTCHLVCCTGDSCTLHMFSLLGSCNWSPVLLHLSHPDCFYLCTCETCSLHLHYLVTCTCITCRSYGMSRGLSYLPHLITYVTYSVVALSPGHPHLRNLITYVTYSLGSFLTLSSTLRSLTTCVTYFCHSFVTWCATLATQSICVTTTTTTRCSCMLCGHVVKKKVSRRCGDVDLRYLAMTADDVDGGGHVDSLSHHINLGTVADIYLRHLHPYE